MWMTKQLTRSRGGMRTETGRFATENSLPAVSATAEWRDVPVYAPFGVSFVPPNGSEALLLRTSSGAACAGTRVHTQEGLEPGEVCLYSEGTRIILKNNGEIRLGGVTILPDGRIRAKEYLTGEEAHGNETD